MIFILLLIFICSRMTGVENSSRAHSTLPPLQMVVFLIRIPLPLTLLLNIIYCWVQMTPLLLSLCTVVQFNSTLCTVVQYNSTLCTTVSMYNVYITNMFQTTFVQLGWVGVHISSCTVLHSCRPAIYKYH